MLHRRLLWTLLALALSACASAPPPAARTPCFHRNAAVEEEVGYCEAVRTGNTLYVSGTVGQGEMPAAVRQAYGNLQKTLAAHGLTFANVVKETVYTTDLDGFIKAKEVRKEFYGKTFPAATWVQVQRLYLPSFVVEVELTAEFPK